MQILKSLYTEHVFYSLSAFYQVCKDIVGKQQVVNVSFQYYRYT